MPHSPLLRDVTLRFTKDYKRSYIIGNIIKNVYFLTHLFLLPSIGKSILYDYEGTLLIVDDNKEILKALEMIMKMRLIR